MATLPEPYRPACHFTPQRGWINDPNGLVYFRNQWHLFYQYLEPAEIDGMQWGHAVSDDLIRWRHLPPALQPDDIGQIWSGSAVVDHSDTCGMFGGKPGMVCLFTYWRASDHRQCQGMAFSSDGVTFTKYAGNPVIPALADDKEFRDPKVFWHKPTERWVMAVAGGTLRIYSSANLIDWRFESVADDLVTECPDLFELPVDGDESRRTWVLSGGGRWYMLGAFDGRRFTPRSERLPMTQGPDFYATQTWSDAPGGRRVAVSWLFNWGYKNRPAAGAIESTFPTEPWSGGCLTVPQELSLRTTTDGVRMVQWPVVEVEALRSPLLKVADVELAPGSPDPLAGVHGTVLDIELTVERRENDSWAMRFPQAGERWYKVGMAGGVLFVDRRNGGYSGVPGFAERFAVPLPAGGGRTVDLRILLDRCSLEVFADRGRVTLPAFVLPEPRGDGVSLMGRGSFRRIAVHLLTVK